LTLNTQKNILEIKNKEKNKMNEQHSLYCKDYASYEDLQMAIKTCQIHNIKVEIYPLGYTLSDSDYPLHMLEPVNDGIIRIFPEMGFTKAFNVIAIELDKQGYVVDEWAFKQLENEINTKELK
jgi:hypothetical protein